MISIADNVRDTCKKKGLSQDKLACFAGIACNTIVKIKSDKNKSLTIETLRSIANVLNTSIDKLIH